MFEEESAETLILERGTYKIIVKEDLEEKLRSSKKLRIKFGIDPTGSKIHLGRASTIQKLKDFQNLGHQIVLIVGDFTARVGDNSDKTDQRPGLTITQIEDNLKEYKTQIGKILDLNKIEFRYNSEWLQKLSFNDIIEIAKQFTVAQMIERDNFIDRFKSQKPIGLHEFLYPLMQGYDSFAIKADVELGGSDQLFNLLAGRDIQRYFKMQEQNIVTKKLLSGTDGRKMSTSWGNVINITDTPQDIYGKVMSIRDEVIIEYFYLTTRIKTEIIQGFEKDLKKGKNPMEIKKILAWEIVKMYSSKKEADYAQEYFKDTVQNKSVRQDNILNVKTDIDSINIVELISNITGQIPSKAEARRIISSGGVSIDGNKVNSIDDIIDIKNGMIIKAGKRSFVKIIKK